MGWIASLASQTGTRISMLDRKNFYVGQHRDIENPEKSVEGKQRVFIDVVECNQQQDEDHPECVRDLLRPEQGPQSAPCTGIAEGKQQEAGCAELEPYLKKTVVRMKDDEAQSDDDVVRLTFHPLPERGKTVAEQRMFLYRGPHLLPDCCSPGKRGIPAK